MKKRMKEVAWQLNEKITTPKISVVPDAAKVCLPFAWRKRGEKTGGSEREGESESGCQVQCVWFHIGLGNDDLMEKLGALKEKKNKPGGKKSRKS